MFYSFNPPRHVLSFISRQEMSDIPADSLCHVIDALVYEKAKTGRIDHNHKTIYIFDYLIFIR